MNVFLLHLRNINLIVNVLYFTFVFLISLTVPEKKKKKGWVGGKIWEVFTV